MSLHSIKLVLCVDDGGHQLTIRAAEFWILLKGIDLICWEVEQWGIAVVDFS